MKTRNTMNRWSYVWLSANLFITLVADQKSTPREVTVSCEAFVENSDSQCTCSINHTAASPAGKCRYPVGQVVLTFCSDVTELTCSRCVFNDYTIGLVGRVDKKLKDCRLEYYDQETKTHVLEVTVLAHAEDHNMSTFRCQPSCVGGTLQQTITGIPVSFSPFCAPGMYGALCNLTCEKDCVDSRCDRDTGFCTQKKDNSNVFIATGVAAPALLGMFLACYMWCKRIMNCLGLAAEVADLSPEVKDDDDDDEDEDDEMSKVDKADKAQETAGPGEEASPKETSPSLSKGSDEGAPASESFMSLFGWGVSGEATASSGSGSRSTVSA